MKSITPNLWFDNNAEEAAEFYTRLFPNSRIEKVLHSPADNPSVKKADVITVDFTLNGQRFVGINGGPAFKFTEAVSFSIDCEDQAEVDRYWGALTADGGSESMCGWCKDRFGLSWQVVPRRLIELLSSDDTEANKRAMEAMLKMKKIDIATLEAAAKGS
ncbi:3-demethylubiquinone-9 3-methyltransferase [Candidatus Filomicrobium marinum]|uniref:3-demethylubiquinone-9 3-methyltransferase n=2 Tax=Filomicrobium TaxID=119044 RepID=A0A0D6JD92_9HYPH|nr:MULTISPECIES: VOC family protein [Filomicrobium]MCV0368125.1 VOC family protein [Filomicrobium sp.]CFX14396.1 3-demethylubiquinone-9 3-methyltransferase [Candidatus Filomicrobium marinum]CPR17785.1 3-demethylubiquinone-9 3-methyltransferase [Candidatus Filomicrobium marinum]SDO28041.1 Glyoxalase superfamily enzyme, possibly 3-demethylubiquinone-9 3-methyltransferase [Filomicrobium insigne]